MAATLAGIALPASMAAQGGGYGTISIATAQGYDGNLLSTTQGSAVRSDMFTRVGPVFEGGYAWDRARLGGRYSFDADRYRQYGDLNRMFAREEAGVEVRLVATPRLRFSADTAYLATETPADLNLDTLLLPGRRPATRFTAASSVVYAMTPRVSLVAGHTYARDTLVGGVGNDLHASRVGTDYRATARNTFGVNYELRQIRFTNAFVDPVTNSAPASQRRLFHVVRGRWVHTFTPSTTLELEGGPHIGEEAIRPEISATVRRESARGEFSLGYSREQTTTIGEARLLDVHRISGGGTFRPVPSVSLTAIPALAFNLRDRLNPDEKPVPVYTLDVESAFQASTRFAVVLTGRFGRQDGVLPGSEDAIVDRRVMGQVVITLVRTRWTPGEWPRVAGGEE
jgi:hypothetical protein